VHVLPRLGTRSPWSSKATDIMQNCGLEIERVERGIVYSFCLSETSDVKKMELALSLTNSPIASLLHDRMTQSLMLQSPTLEQLFMVAEAGNLKTVQQSHFCI
jgi:phosphoribosylformylglycinamidine synthase